MVHIFPCNRPGEVHYGTTGMQTTSYALKIVAEADRTVGRGGRGSPRRRLFLRPR